MIKLKLNLTQDLQILKGKLNKTNNFKYFLIVNLG